MSVPLEAFVFLVLGGLVLLLGAYFACETWLRAWEQRVPSPLVQGLHVAGADPQRLARSEVSREIAAAERSCAICAASGACREWLESGPAHGYAFCPNAALVERLTR